MADLDTKDRERLRSSQFANVDSTGGEHLPINDASHVRRRVQRAVDRRFNRARYDAERTSGLFAVEVREALDPSRTPASLLRAVESTMRPRRVAIWIRDERRLSLVRAVGFPGLVVDMRR